MSMNSRYRERKYNTSENDRLIRALSQPVQAWDKKWTVHSNSKTLQTYKWVKSERTIEYEQDEESEEELEPMDNEPTLDTPQIGTTTTTIQQQQDGQSMITTTTVETTVTEPREDGIPGGPSSLLNKAVASIQHEDTEEDDSRSQTPKLDDISDEEPDVNMDGDDDDENDADNINDPSKHPALAPHAQAHLTDDDMTDSTAATPQTMPPLDDDMEQEPIQQAHPLSQEILTGIMAQDDVASMNNDSPAIQTPEDTVTASHPHNPIRDQ